VHIFVDESGTFVTRDDGSSVGAVGALVVTESQFPDFSRRYEQLRPLLQKDADEVKGRLLAERNVARVVNVARRSGLIYEVTVIDFPKDRGPEIAEHRARQCEALTGGLTEAHQPSLVAAVQALRRRLEEMPLQLYAQCVATFDVLWTTLKHAILYYCQREPHSLSRFHWVIDAKAVNGITGWEEWWTTIVRPHLQARALREPFPRLEEGDYSHIAGGEMQAPAYLVKDFPGLAGKKGINLGNAFAEIEFQPDPLAGLEVVDVLTNAIRRALIGRLGVRGWEGISGIMIDRGVPYVHMAGFANDRRPVAEPAASVLRQLSTGGRSMMTWPASTIFAGGDFYSCRF
jgi:hypothetical protein